MWRKLVIGLIAPLVAVALAVPAQADANAQEQQFLRALKAAGWTINDPSGAITQGHMVCGEGLAHHVPWQEMRTTLMSWGYSRSDASTLISKAVSVFCPKYSKVIAEIQNDSGNPGGGPTNGDGAELVQEVRDRGILQNMYDSMIVQTLAAICDSARNLAPYGVTDDDLADSVLAGYGLSKKDAKWLIKTSLAKCHWT
jgi:hypothetical protein